MVHFGTIVQKIVKKLVKVRQRSWVMIFGYFAQLLRTYDQPLKECELFT